MMIEQENERKMIAEDPRSQAILALALRASHSPATILITGETGVGKEVLARYIHENSPYANGPFVSVNCAALPDNMVEAILFGYEKGAFTNAINQYEGKFEQANHGTLLLDEVSELPYGLQAKLLRVLQEREVERLGGRKVIKVNVRVIAATNRDLRQLVATGYFRQDLYYRLNVIPIHCVALRERPFDIVPLANFFMRKYSAISGKSVSRLTQAAKQKLVKCQWLGNVRELENVIQRSLIMTTNDVIDESDIELCEDVYQGAMTQCAGAGYEQLSSVLKVGEAKIIMDVLKETEGRRAIAAKKLNISPRTLRYKISKLKLIGLKVP